MEEVRGVGLRNQQHPLLGVQPKAKPIAPKSRHPAPQGTPTPHPTSPPPPSPPARAPSETGVWWNRRVRVGHARSSKSAFCGPNLVLRTTQGRFPGCRVRRTRTPSKHPCTGGPCGVGTSATSAPREGWVVGGADLPPPVPPLLPTTGVTATHRHTRRYRTALYWQNEPWKTGVGCLNGVVGGPGVG